MIESINSRNPTEIIAKAMLAYCYNSDIGNFHLNTYLESNKISLGNNTDYLRLSLSAFRLAAGIIFLREKYGEKVEPIVRQIYKQFTDISFSGEFADVGMTLTSLCKWYCANWLQVPPESELLPLPENENIRMLLAAFLLNPLSEYNHEIEISDDLCTLIYRNMSIAQNAANLITSQVERDFECFPALRRDLFLQGPHFGKVF
jgi:hypothetical protein